MEDVPVIKKDFGSVYCGQEVRDTFKIDNTSHASQVIAVVPREERADVLYDRVRIHPLKATAGPGKSVRFTLTYISYLENVTDNFSFDVIDSESVAARVEVRAQCVGPSLDFTSHILKFFCFRDVHDTAKHVEIVNATKCEAKFCFDLDEDYQTIRISQKSGVIPAGFKLNLKVTFNPSQVGVYHKQIFCVVQYHKPIVFSVLGIYRPKLRREPKSIQFKYPIQLRHSNDYEAYMAKVIDEKLPEEKRVPFCQNYIEEYKMYLDETSAEHSDENNQIGSLSHHELKSKSSFEKMSDVVLTTNFIDLRNLREVPKATILVNLSKSQHYCYQWDHDPKNHFQIEPCKGIIEPSRRITFYITFTPSSPDLLYHAELDLRVYPWNQESEVDPPQSVDLPLTMSLRIIGHSFPDDSCGWIPQCAVVPKSLRLPSCVPGEIVHGTFTLERRGHLPVSFAIVPPKDSSYAVQPPLGFFSSSFQIFVVQFNAQSREKGVYREDLKIIFNNSASNFVVIQLSVVVEVPQVIIGTDNSYTFETAFPKSKTFASIPIKNPTNISIKYEFNVPDHMTWVDIPNPTGMIEPLSHGEVQVIFQPVTPCHYLDFVPCSVSSTSSADYFETIPLQLIGFCQFGYLIATPSVYDFGECVYNSKKTITIHLFNFSPVLIHFRLDSVHRGFPIGDPEKDIKITPGRGSLGAKGSLEVEVMIEPHDRDILQYAITCQNMESDSEDSVPCEEPKIIFSFRFEGVLPAFQIVDLNLDAGGPLFSPHWVWKMMCIDRINKALNSLTPEEEIEFKFPEAMPNSNPIAIALLIEANRHGDIVWDSSTHIDCSCSEELRVGVCQTTSCEHEKAIIITPAKTKLGPKERAIVQIILNHTFPGECKLFWTIRLPFRRRVSLKASLVALPIEELWFTSSYLASTFSLKPIYVGDSDPPLQLFWLYNNTHKPTSYVVDKMTLRQVTANGCRIFDCINPNGVIPPFSSAPLVFLFKPNEIMSYAVTVSLCLIEGKLTNLHLTGEGIPNVQQFSELALEKTVPEKPILYNLTVDLETCVSFVNIAFLRTFSQAKRIFFLRNRSETQVWAFQWHRFKVENIINARVEPEKGSIEPGQKQPMTLVVQSLLHPTLIGFSIPCDVVNYSLLVRYETALRYRDEMADKCKDYFTITEKGTSCGIPEIPIPKKPEPRHLFITVNVNIIKGTNVDQKLTRTQQLTMKAENEMDGDFFFGPSVKSSMLPSIHQILEKMLWNILNGVIFKEKIKHIEKSQDYSYLQIMPGSKKKLEDIIERMSTTPSKKYVQNVLENTLMETLCKSLCNKDSQNKAPCQEENF